MSIHLLNALLLYMYTAKNALVPARSLQASSLAVIKPISGCFRIACCAIKLSTDVIQVDCEDFLFKKKDFIHKLKMLLTKSALIPFLIVLFRMQNNASLLLKFFDNLFKLDGGICWTIKLHINSNMWPAASDSMCQSNTKFKEFAAICCEAVKMATCDASKV